MENKMNENPRDEEDEVLDCISELFSLKNLLIVMFIALLGCVYIACNQHRRFFRGRLFSWLAIQFDGYLLRCSD